MIVFVSITFEVVKSRG